MSNHLPIINIYNYIYLYSYSNSQRFNIGCFCHIQTSLSFTFEILERSIWEDSESKRQLRQSCVLCFSNRSVFWHRSLWSALQHFLFFICCCWKSKRKRLVFPPRATGGNNKSNISVFDEEFSQNTQCFWLRYWSMGSKTDAGEAQVGQCSSYW